MKLRCKNIVYFVLLSSFLLVCLFLRSIDRRFEVFPSVTLPSFASKIRTDGDLDLSKKELYGIDVNGNRKKLNHSKFFRNIPIQFARSIMVNRFGLVSDYPKQFSTSRFNLKYSISLKVTSDEIYKTKEWLRDRLREQGCNDTVLIIDKRTIRIFSNRTFEIAKSLENDTIYKFY